MGYHLPKSSVRYDLPLDRYNYMLLPSSKFPAARTSCIQLYHVIQMTLDHADNNYDITNRVAVTLVP